MDKTTIILVRHGFSVANARDEFAGFYNIPLDPLGREQAKHTADYLRSYSMDVLYSSDLIRTMETAQPISESTGLPIHKDSGLREINGGDWESMSVSTLWKDHTEAFTIWRQDKIHAKCPNGESTLQMQNRVLSAVENIVAKHTGETICIVSHATPIWALGRLWWSPEQERPEPLPYVPNASVTVAEYDGQAYRLLQYGYAEHLASCQIAKKP